MENKTYTELYDQYKKEIDSPAKLYISLLVGEEIENRDLELCINLVCDYIYRMWMKTEGFAFDSMVSKLFYDRSEYEILDIISSGKNICDEMII